MERDIGLQHQREPQHVLVPDAVLHQGLEIVGEEVIFQDGMDAKAVALVIDKLMAEAAGAQLDATHALLGQARQHEVKQAGADAFLLVGWGHGDIEDLGRSIPDEASHAGPYHLVALSGCKTPGAGQIGIDALLGRICFQQQRHGQLAGIDLTIFQLYFTPLSG